MPEPGKRHVLAVVTDTIPSCIINVITPMQEMDRRGLLHARIRTEDSVTPQDVSWADVLVLCRNMDPTYRPVYDLAQQLGVPMIYDLDDYFVAVPPTHQTYAAINNPDRRQHYKWLLRNSHLVRVHSPVVEAHVREFNQNVRLVWAAVDWSLVPETLPELDSGKFHVVYVAQAETGRSLFPFMEADLKTLLDRHANVRLHFLGYEPPSMCDHPQVICQPFQQDYETFFRAFTRFGYAVGLAPMLLDDFHQGKTNLKYRDYAAAGAAGIYTDCPLYRNGVVHEETGLLVSGEPGSWLPAIERLMQDRQLLQSIRQQARQQVEAKYNMDTVVDMWMEDIESPPARPPLDNTMHAHVESLRWWFTGRRERQQKTILAPLRRLLRRTLPSRYKIIYYDAIRRLRNFTKRHTNHT
jgi:glycosyltransferase involved in cell wall biosynthesis